MIGRDGKGGIDGWIYFKEIMKKAELFSLDSGITSNSNYGPEEDLPISMSRRMSHLEEDGEMYKEAARRYLT